MATVFDIFGFVLRSELDGLEQELVQTVRERILREGDAFPGVANKIVATIEVDLDKVVRSSTSCRTVQQLQGMDE